MEQTHCGGMFSTVTKMVGKTIQDAKKCERGHGSCTWDAQCSKDLKCGHRNCYMLRDHMGLPVAGYGKNDNCCYNHHSDYKYFGVKSYFENRKDANKCSDKADVTKCMRQHGYTPNKKETTKNTCNYMKEKNMCSDDFEKDKHFNDAMKLTMLCCEHTCEYCSSVDSAGVSLRQVSRHLHV